MTSSRQWGRFLGFLFLLLCLSCGEDYLTPFSRCNLPCYDGPPGTAGVGQCKAGRYQCNEEGIPIACIGEVLPSIELCDDLDNWCRGFVDIHPLDETYHQPCGSNLGFCHPGIVECVEGKLTCIGATVPQEEDCSGLDKNCNGIIDDIVAMLCYDGDPQDLSYPKAECRAGVTGCREGAPACLGEVLPAPENCGDFKDRNCNGIIDDVTSTEVDFVIILDRSSSMTDKYPTLKSALISLAAMHSSSDYRYSIINVPGPTRDDSPSLELAFTDATTFASHLAMLYPSLGGEEFSYDAFMTLAATCFNQEWRPEAKRIALWFGDETAQTKYNLLPAMVTPALVSADITLFAFVLPEFFPDYLPLTSATHGQVVDLLMTSILIGDVLPETLGGCQ